MLYQNKRATGYSPHRSFCYKNPVAKAPGSDTIYCQLFGGGGNGLTAPVAPRLANVGFSKYCLPLSLKRKTSPNTPIAVPIGNDRQLMTEAMIAHVRAHGLCLRSP